jgi:hypothetical protein
MASMFIDSRLTPMVRTGAVRDNAVDILSGVAAGETVIIDPPAALREGRREKIVP